MDRRGQLVRLARLRGEVGQGAPQEGEQVLGDALRRIDALILLLLIVDACRHDLLRDRRELLERERARVVGVNLLEDPPRLVLVHAEFRHAIGELGCVEAARLIDIELFKHRDGRRQVKGKILDDHLRQGDGRPALALVFHHGSEKEAVMRDRQRQPSHATRRESSSF